MVDVVDSKSTAGDSVPVRVRSPAPSPFAVVDTMAAKGDFLFCTYLTRNMVFPELFAYLLAFYRYMMIGVLFSSCRDSLA